MHVPGTWAFCGSDCPMHPHAFTADDRLKVTRDDTMDPRDVKIATQLICVISSSLLIIALMIQGLGNNYLVLKINIYGFVHILTGAGGML